MTGDCKIYKACSDVSEYRRKISLQDEASLDLTVACLHLFPPALIGQWSVASPSNIPSQEHR